MSTPALSSRTSFATTRTSSTNNELSTPADYLPVHDYFTRASSSLGDDTNDGKKAEHEAESPATDVAHPLYSPRSISTESAAPYTRPQPLQSATSPLATTPNGNLAVDVEMVARKYHGYWRASFIATVPACVAMCGCVLLISGSPTPSVVPDTAESQEQGSQLITLLDAVSSPGQMIHALHAQNLEIVTVALKLGLERGRIPIVKPKVALPLYEKLQQATTDPTKLAKVWQQFAKALTKMPHETLIPLLLIASVGRRLQGKRWATNRRPVAISLLEDFWPLPSPQMRENSGVGVRDSLSRMLLDHWEDIPEELPLIVQALNHRFPSGSKCNLLDLLGSRQGKGQQGD